MADRVVGFVVESDRGAYTIYEPTDEMVERAILAASRPIEGCHIEGVGGCGGTHTECYYRAILEAALTPSPQDSQSRQEVE